MTEILRLRAPAKLNLGLRVLGRRADGFHDLETLTVALTDPHDDIVVSRLAAGRGVHLAIGGDCHDVPDDASNLAAQAAVQLLEALGRREGIEIAIHKRTPTGAGLGGASADAAATLRGIRQLLAPELPDAELESIAMRLGSDVKFCLGGRAAWMGGRGEILDPTPSPPLRTLVAVPAVRCSTAAVYAQWDALGGPTGRRVPAPAGLEHDGDLRNDLEPAAWSLHPELEEFQQAIESECGRPAVMTGSGSAYAVLFADDETPGRAVTGVRERTGALVFTGAVVAASS